MKYCILCIMIRIVERQRESLYVIDALATKFVSADACLFCHYLAQENQHSAAHFNFSTVAQLSLSHQVTAGLRADRVFLRRQSGLSHLPSTGFHTA